MWDLQTLKSGTHPTSSNEARQVLLISEASMMLTVNFFQHMEKS